MAEDSVFIGFVEIEGLEESICIWKIGTLEFELVLFSTREEDTDEPLGIKIVETVEEDIEMEARKWLMKRKARKGSGRPLKGP
jgi:hypothetical protein